MREIRNIIKSNIEADKESIKKAKRLVKESEIIDKEIKEML